MKRYTYKPGEWNVTCQVCGFRFPASKIKTRWDGLLVCSEDYETRHPQDLIRVPQEDTSVPYSSPPQETFIHTCSIITQHPYADVGEADCARVDFNYYSYEQCI